MKHYCLIFMHPRVYNVYILLYIIVGFVAFPLAPPPKECYNIGDL